jgi:hypothetical protein
MNKAVEGRKRGIQWRMMERLEDHDFTDDILLLQRWSDTKTKLKKLDKEPAKVKFKINEFKTKEMRVKPSTNLVLTINGRDDVQIKSFTCPCSIVLYRWRSIRRCQWSYQEGQWGLNATVPSLEELLYLRIKIRLLNTHV